jgi:hypothetical protein
VDPRHEHEALKCRYGEADLCKEHIIGRCVLFGRLRDQARKGHITPPQLTKELVLDDVWGERVWDFLRKARLGFTKDLNTN